MMFNWICCMYNTVLAVCMIIEIHIIQRIQKQALDLEDVDNVISRCHPVSLLLIVSFNFDYRGRHLSYPVMRSSHIIVWFMGHVITVYESISAVCWHCFFNLCAYQINDYQTPSSITFMPFIVTRNAHECWLM